ncbi:MULTISPECIES: hypothetical protein [unclassified Mesorhizobium]|uniref:hypothetical protein n=1 Tax=unclassified Mesorhizobium TaxID=325217 RepID=UPI000F7557F8|nr:MULTISPECIES: hypothetical protein [unclassified Mesorhizobium]AZO55671.1 hypothetical protein EJ077_21215 [Mesorhizobium sp. M8A.F.Ca.ET.057.01.1.1]RWE42843.1 MAG: hypothetical protein EOS80_24285 [Mesorhizobium sp.]TJX77540.1 MAG: hypothetical protein E5W21_03020 [Mesorhizobium sp.]
MFRATNPDAYQPEEIDLLQRVFDRRCTAANIHRDSILGELLAAALIQLYQAGVTDEVSLSDKGREYLAMTTAHPAFQMRGAIGKTDPTGAP